MKKFLVFFALIAVSTASDLNLNELCNGILFATLEHPTNQNLFIGCIQGRGTIFGCSKEDEVFDQYLVACVSGNSPVNPDHEKLCADVVFGWFPHEESCSLYVVCEFSRPNIRSCPDNSIFNPYLPGCVPGDQDTCEFLNTPTSSEGTTITDADTTSVEQITTTEATTTEATTTTEQTTTAESSTVTVPSTQTQTVRSSTTGNPNNVNISFVCPSSGYGNIPHQTDCSRYFECNQGIRFVKNCPSGLIFDVISSQCDSSSTSLCANNIRCQ